MVKQPENYETVDSDLDMRITPAKRVTSSTWGPPNEIWGKSLGVWHPTSPVNARRLLALHCHCRSFLQSGCANVFARVTIILNSTPSNFPQRLNGTLIKV